MLQQMTNPVEHNALAIVLKDSVDPVIRFAGFKVNQSSNECFNPR